MRERRALLRASSKQTDEDLAWHHDDLNQLIVGSLGQLEDQRRVLERRMAAQEQILLLQHRSTNRSDQDNWTSLDPSASGGGWGGGEKDKETEKEAVIAIALTIAERGEKEKENHGQQHALAKLYRDWDALTAEIQKLKLYHIEVHTASGAQ